MFCSTTVYDIDVKQLTKVFENIKCLKRINCEDQYYHEFYLLGENIYLRVDNNFPKQINFPKEIKLYWSNSRDKVGNLSFENVFNLVTDEIKKELVFYLDLFNK